MVLKAARRKTEGKTFGKKKIGVISALFNDEICARLRRGALDALCENGVRKEDIVALTVPGAFEIPLVAKKLAARRDVDGVIAIGCVIRGDTPHFEFVSLAATMGCLNAGLDVGKPISFGVITVNNREQAERRSAHDAFNKGREAALALLDTLATLEKI